MWLVTGDVDIVEYTIGRGMAPVHSGYPAHNLINQNYLIKVGHLWRDIIIGESCDGDMEIESGGEVGTLVSWHTLAQAPDS